MRKNAKNPFKSSKKFKNRSHNNYYSRLKYWNRIPFPNCKKSLQNPKKCIKIAINSNNSSRQNLLYREHLLETDFVYECKNIAAKYETPKNCIKNRQNSGGQICIITVVTDCKLTLCMTVKKHRRMQKKKKNHNKSRKIK